MSILKIAQIGDPILSQKAKDVLFPEIDTKSFQEIIDNMIDTLDDEEGIGLAAPQIFITKRILLLSSKPTKNSFRKVKIPQTIIINPQIIKKSKEIELDWEGCLSVAGGDLLGLVPRHQKIKISGLNRYGKRITLNAASLKARIIQHEMDHLDGVLFLQRMRKKDLRNLSHRKEWTIHQRPKWPKPRLLQ